MSAKRHIAATVGRTETRAKMRPRKLAYRIVGPEVMLADHLWAERNQAIRLALRTARTWADLERGMPKGDFKRLLSAYRRDSEDPRMRPAPRDPFDPDADVGGYADGDYPDWSRHRLEEWLPRELLEKHGRREWNMINGDWWTINLDNWPGLMTDLEHRGYTLVERNDLTEVY